MDDCRGWVVVVLCIISEKFFNKGFNTLAMNEIEKFGWVLIPIGVIIFIVGLSFYEDFKNAGYPSHITISILIITIGLTIIFEIIGIAELKDLFFSRSDF